MGLIALACRRMLTRVEVGTHPRGDAFRLYLMLYGGLRVLLDPLRADARPERLLGFSYQQGLALLVMALAIVWRRRSRPNHLRSDAEIVDVAMLRRFWKL